MQFHTLYFITIFKSFEKIMMMKMMIMMMMMMMITCKAKQNDECRRPKESSVPLWSWSGFLKHFHFLLEHEKMDKNI